MSSISSFFDALFHHPAPAPDPVVVIPAIPVSLPAPAPVPAPVSAPAVVSRVYSSKLFYGSVRHSLFGGSLSQGQVDGMDHLLGVWANFYAKDQPDLRFLAYPLATCFHETGKAMAPVREWGQGKGRSYGHPEGPWHNVYYGRGDVQLTWEANYKKASEKLNAKFGLKLDLDKNPDQALDPDVAAHTMFLGMEEGWFTGKKLSDYFGAASDAVNARRIINGTDKAQIIAGYNTHFVEALKAAAA